VILRREEFWTNIYTQYLFYLSENPWQLWNWDRKRFPPFQVVSWKVSIVLFSKSGGLQPGRSSGARYDNIVFWWHGNRIILFSRQYYARNPNPFPQPERFWRRAWRKANRSLQCSLCTSTRLCTLPSMGENHCTLPVRGPINPLHCLCGTLGVKIPFEQGQDLVCWWFGFASAHGSSTIAERKDSLVVPSLMSHMLGAGVWIPKSGAALPPAGRHGGESLSAYRLCCAAFYFVLAVVRDMNGNERKSTATSPLYPEGMRRLAWRKEENNGSWYRDNIHDHEVLGLDNCRQYISTWSSWTRIQYIPFAR